MCVCAIIVCQRTAAAFVFRELFGHEVCRNSKFAFVYSKHVIYLGVQVWLRRFKSRRY